MHQICNSRSLEAPGEHPRGALAEGKQRLTATAPTPEAERETESTKHGVITHCLPAGVKVSVVGLAPKRGVCAASQVTVRARAVCGSLPQENSGNRQSSDVTRPYPLFFSGASLVSVKQE